MYHSYTDIIDYDETHVIPKGFHYDKTDTCIIYICCAFKRVIFIMEIAS